MIETLEAKNGCRVVRVDGRLLSSAVDPLSEARDWVLRRKLMLNQVKSVFILGAGSGYHVSELFIHTDAMLIVIDSSQELIEAVQSIQNFQSGRVQFVSVQKASALRAQEAVRTGVGGSFVVLRHAPSILNNSDFFAECEALLVGREWGSLNWQWQLKGFAALDEQPKIHASEQALTIYDLEQTELVQDSTERERMLVKALRELVK